MHNQQESSSLTVVAVAVAMTVSMTVVTAMVSVTVTMSVTVGTSVAVSMAVVGIGLSISLSGPLAPGHGSEGVSGQTGGVVVAVESRVDVVVQDSNTVAVVGIGIGAPLAVVVADNTVETLRGPGNVGRGHTGVGSNAKTESVAVSIVSVSAPLPKVVSTLNNISIIFEKI